MRKRKKLEQDLNLHADNMVETMDQANESMDDGEDEININDNDSVHGEGEVDEEEELEDMIPSTPHNLNEIYLEEYLTLGEMILPNKEVSYMMLNGEFSQCNYAASMTKKTFYGCSASGLV